MRDKLFILYLACGLSLAAVGALSFARPHPLVLQGGGLLSTSAIFLARAFAYWRSRNA